MATYFKNKVVKNVGTIPILGIETDASTRSTVLGLNLSNLTGGIVYVSILLNDDTSNQGYYLKDVSLPPNTSLKTLSAGEKLILAPINQLFIVSTEDDSVDVIISYVDII